MILYFLIVYPFMAIGFAADHDPRFLFLSKRAGELPMRAAHSVSSTSLFGFCLFFHGFMA